MRSLLVRRGAYAVCVLKDSGPRVDSGLGSNLGRCFRLVLSIQEYRLRSCLTRNLRGEGQPCYGLVFSSGMEEVALLVATRGYDLQRQLVCCFYLKPLNKYQLESVAQKIYIRYLQ